MPNANLLAVEFFLIQMSSREYLLIASVRYRTVEDGTADAVAGVE